MKGYYVEIERKHLERLAMVQCTIEEICSVFDCSRDTLENRIREWYDMTPGEWLKHYAGRGVVTLRRQGFRMAIKGDRDMTKFMLKNFGGMSDRVDHTHAGPKGGDIPISITRRIVQVTETPIPDADAGNND